MKLLPLFAAAALALAGVAGPAQSEDIKLRIASGHPTANTYVNLMQGFFAPEVTKRVKERTKHTVEFISIGVSLGGLAIAALLFLKAPGVVDGVAKNPVGSLLRRYWFAAWGFDWIYDKLFVVPYLWFTRVNAKDAADVAIGMIPTTLRGAHSALARTQTGQIRWYAMGVAAGAVLILGAVALL